MRLSIAACGVVMFVVAALSFTACSKQSSQDTTTTSSANLLLGTWNLDTSAGATSSPYCSVATPIVFTATTQTRPDADGKPSTIPVTYVTGETTTFPTVVYLMTDAGITAHVTYRFLSRDTMILDTALQCQYVRASN
jgi:uncharacterized membrane protein YoaK (UPF0700 family)